MSLNGANGYKGYNINVQSSLIMQSGISEPSTPKTDWTMLIGGLLGTVGNVTAGIIAAKKGVTPATTTITNTNMFNTGCFNFGTTSGTSTTAQTVSIFGGLAQQGLNIYQQSRTPQQAAGGQVSFVQQGVRAKSSSSTQLSSDARKEKTFFEYMDKNGDGKITIDELKKYYDFEETALAACRGNINSETYKKMIEIAQRMNDRIEKGAGSDGVYSSKEEVRQMSKTIKEDHDKFIELWHSSKGAEEFFVECINRGDVSIENGNLTSNAVKDSINIRTMVSRGKVELSQEEKEKLFALIDKYAGDDGNFTQEEFEQLKATPEFVAWKAKFND